MKDDIMVANDARILIADDDSVSLYLLSSVFSEGFTVCCVKSGEEALNTVLTFKPDIIILDIVMKGIYGYEVCERLKANRDTADIPVVFISSREDVEAEIAGLKAGGIDFITKPFNPAIVRMRITNYIELKRTRDNLEQMSITDQLTGLYNRRYFDRMLTSEIRRSSRSHDCLSLLMIDIDRFKIYNDSNGHLAGDECLKLICHTVKKTFRRVGDLVSRYGGEELAVLLPSTGLISACMLAENTRKNVEELQISYTGVPENGNVTISIGVAAATPEPGANPQQILNDADKALYQAKTKGRNKIVAAQ
jgi:diguanylate cyclase (GGDEF)-like protein